MMDYNIDSTPQTMAWLVLRTYCISFLVTFEFLKQESGGEKRATCERVKRVHSHVTENHLLSCHCIFWEFPPLNISAKHVQCPVVICYMENKQNLYKIKN